MPRTSALNPLTWRGKTNVSVVWGNEVGQEDYALYQYRFPVRKNTAQAMQYTFRDQYGTAIDLSGYTSTSLVVKFQGEVFSTQAGTISSPTTGVVTCAYAYTKEGIWDAQFVCTDGLNNKLYGEPVQFRVVPNIDDLILDQLPAY